MLMKYGNSSKLVSNQLDSINFIFHFNFCSIGKCSTIPTLITVVKFSFGNLQIETAFIQNLTKRRSKFLTKVWPWRRVISPNKLSASFSKIYSTA